MIARLRALVVRVWHEEPVRTALAPIILALVAAGLARFGVDANVAGLIGVVVLGALGLTAQEIARAKVIPTRKAEQVLDSVIPAAEHAIEDNLGAVSKSADTAIKVTVEEISRRLRGSQG
ncbi:holin [Gordonia phage Margaret]|nr:holin [Gordonia phage Margaret]